jgi:hypothetical protein
VAYSMTLVGNFKKAFLFGLSYGSRYGAEGP